MNPRTAKFRKLYWIFKTLDILFSIGPFIYFISYGVATGSTQTKLIMVMSASAGIVLTFFAMMLKYRWRSPYLFLILALTAALDKIRVAIIVIAVLTLIDELILEPLTKKFALKLNINKEMDKREAQA